MKIYWHDRKNNIHIKADSMDEFKKGMLKKYKVDSKEKLFEDERKAIVMAGIYKYFRAYLKEKPLGKTYSRFLYLIDKVEQINEVRRQNDMDE